ncbi:hypothetical protein COLO4_24049 [Corchorus olitorius]|uniref:Morc S5 domain-containing protein n=1 Tax=Corchorus olitorius TaxID=93759 RepID=A0A1R3ID87_9ROSI|nr:hypothetical protein COLO4_24049 [Corchorus olitorius]
MAVVQNKEYNVKVKAEADNLLGKKSQDRQIQNPIDISSGSSSSSSNASSSDSSDIEDSLISHNSLPKLGQNKRNSDDPGYAFSTKKPKVESFDMLKNQKDKSNMLLVEDNGGGMNPEKMRSCMSLGYSSKSKMANTIGQYGNGFKTSTMRLGADVIVFSQSLGKDGKRLPTNFRMVLRAGSSGRGVLGVLEANFVEPAHDKQGFERTIVLSRLEAKLVSMQKYYWFKNCHEVGYAARRPTKNSEDTSFVPCVVGENPTQKEQGSSNMKSNVKEKSSCPPGGDPKLKHNLQDKSSSHSNKNANHSVRGGSRLQFDNKFEPTSLVDEASEDESASRGSTPLKGESQQGPRPNTRSSNLKATKVNKDGEEPSKTDTKSITELKAENNDLRKRLDKMNGDLHSERERCKSLEGQLKQEKHMREVSEKEQDALIEIIEEERRRRDEEEERLRKRLTDASVTIDELVEKVKRLESRGVAGIKKEQLK